MSRPFRLALPSKGRMHAPAVAARPRRRHRGRGERPRALLALLPVGHRGAVRALRRHPGLGGRRRRRGGRGRPKPADRGRLGGAASCCRSASGAAGWSWPSPTTRRCDGRPTWTAAGWPPPIPPPPAASSREAGVDVQVVAIHGSVELAPRLDAAEAICDLVSSGETLRSERPARGRDGARVGGRAARPAGPRRAPAGDRAIAGDGDGERDRGPRQALPDAERAGRLAARP